MLDKSIPYKNIIMEIKAEDVPLIEEPVLPPGYNFKFFEDGDEIHWARIETSVLEFDSNEEALDYFKRDYIPHQELLKERCLFIVDKNGLPVATSTAWFAMSGLGYQPSLHWVGVCPEYQGLGLGKAIAKKCTKIFAKTDAGCNVLLHTQTWSYKAIKIYNDFGYNLMKSKRIALLSNDETGTKILQNDFETAIPILKGLYDENTFNKLLNSAV